MIFATAAQFFGDGILWIILIGALMVHFGKKYAAANPDVKDHAKKAASHVAMRLITRLFKH
ncbi:MAG TPA: hypothetical protein VFE25_11930 [Opitutaceae bacterium]|jgi:hypothetical protein|nr:hypothetical protein [Opitutaceae bacterium]